MALSMIKSISVESQNYNVWEDNLMPAGRHTGRLLCCMCVCVCVQCKSVSLSVVDDNHSGSRISNTTTPRNKRCLKRIKIPRDEIRDRKEGKRCSLSTEWQKEFYVKVFNLLHGQSSKHFWDRKQNLTVLPSTAIISREDNKLACLIFFLWQAVELYKRTQTHDLSWLYFCPYQQVPKKNQYLS